MREYSRQRAKNRQCSLRLTLLWCKTGLWWSVTSLMAGTSFWLTLTWPGLPWNDISPSFSWCGVMTKSAADPSFCPEYFIITVLVTFSGDWRVSVRPAGSLHHDLYREWVAADGPGSLCRIKNALLQNFAIINSVFLCYTQYSGGWGQATCNFLFFTRFSTNNFHDGSFNCCVITPMPIYDINVLDNNKPKYHGKQRSCEL